jgi:MerR family transcriptional regulator, light-induced transcriptional regulator
VPDHHDDTRDRDIELATELQRAYGDALLAGDPPAAERIVREAIDAGLSEAVIDDLIIRPALVLIGDLWADGRISVAEEHLATSISMGVVTLQREAFRVARRRASERVLLAGAQGERHIVGLEMAASVIAHAGYDVRLFGADVPIGDLRPAIERHRPAVVGFTSASSLTAINLPSAFDAVRLAAPATGIVVGGRGVDERISTSWDVVICRHISEAVEQVDGLVRRARHN